MVAVAAILKIETRRFPKGTFPSSTPPTRTLKIESQVYVDRYLHCKSYLSDSTQRKQQRTW
jgi:hypothetical protein